MVGRSAEVVEPAFVLHLRPWRETSLIAELLTATSGRVGVVGRGMRRGRRGGGNPLQPFVLLQCAWRGGGELKTLVRAEPERPRTLVGDALYAGLYLNELLLRLLEREDPHPALFADYASTIELLAAGRPLEPVLRRFELATLDSLGYGFPLDHDSTGRPVRADLAYVLDPAAGLVAAADGVREGADPAALSGADLLAAAAGDLEAEGPRRTAKRLTRAALAPLLGPRPLGSRALFARRRGQGGADGGREEPDGGS